MGIISKSCENNVVLWEPVIEEKTVQKAKIVTVVEGKRFENWFMKFGVTRDNTFLAQGTTEGNVYVWRLQHENPQSTRQRLRYPEMSNNLTSTKFDNNPA